ncbi:MAG TPA: metal-dependent hydrolase, partial [Pirellulales bacterium]|nr:metal-dependent hydrolase [Pirellulales bacterium]
MPGFKIHISGSTILGVGYGAGALVLYNERLDTCLLATGLCSVSGMLPDLDSGPGIPLRESLSFAAAFVPMLLFDRARQMGWSHESMVLAGAAIYVAIRFGLGWFLRHYSVHRGIYHSIPVCLIFAGLAFLLCNTGSLPLRYYKAGAVVIGFMSHLILDEIWSVERSGVGLHLKSSFGTAVKFYSPCWWSNALAYATLFAVAVLVLNDPIWADVSPAAARLHSVASDIVDRVDQDADQIETDAPAVEQRAGSIVSEVETDVQAFDRTQPF